MNIRLIFASIALLLATITNAHAVAIVTTTQGVLAGEDGIGLFGEQGAVISGLEYTFTVRYLRESAGPQNRDANSDFVWAGVSPFSITLTAAGRVVYIPMAGGQLGNWVSDGDPSGNPDWMNIEAYGGGDGFSFWLSQTVASETDWIGSQPKLGRSYSLELGPDDRGEEGLNFYYVRPDTIDPENWYSNFETQITSISMYREGNAIPEPGSITLIAAGLLAAFSIRRKKFKAQ